MTNFCAFWTAQARNFVHNYVTALLCNAWVSAGQKSEEIFKKVLAVASGAGTKLENLGYGDLELVPWQIGAAM